MSKRLWLIPILIVAINAAAIAIKWGSLQEILPAHFDLEGNAGGVMQRNILLTYPLISAIVGLIFYLIAKRKHKLQKGLVILASGVGLILLCSTLVTLTSGTMPIFMVSEPIILLVAIVAFIICVIKSRKN